MTRRTIILVLLTAAATVAGLSQTLIYMTCPPMRMVLWFPLAVIAKRVTHDDFAMVCAALLQFPLFAFVLTIFLRRWPGAWGLALIGLIYVLLAATAFGIISLLVPKVSE